MPKPAIKSKLIPLEAMKEAIRNGGSVMFNATEGSQHITRLEDLPDAATHACLAGNEADLDEAEEDLDAQSKILERKYRALESRRKALADSEAQKTVNPPQDAPAPSQEAQVGTRDVTPSGQVGTQKVDSLGNPIVAEAQQAIDEDAAQGLPTVPDPTIEGIALPGDQPPSDQAGGKKKSK